MKIEFGTDAEVRVQASLDDAGNLACRMAATAIYDAETGATTTAVFPLSHETETALRAALERALVENVGQIGPALMQSIATCRDVAGRLGELHGSVPPPTPIVKEVSTWKFWNGWFTR